MGDVTRFRNYPQMATVKKAAETFGVSPSYLRRLCKAGKIIFVNTGHVWLILQIQIQIQVQIQVQLQLQIYHQLPPQIHPLPR